MTTLSIAADESRLPTEAPLTKVACICDGPRFSKTDIETAMAEAINLDRESTILLMLSQFRNATAPVPIKDVIEMIRALPVIASIEDDEPSAIIV